MRKIYDYHYTIIKIAVVYNISDAIDRIIMFIRNKKKNDYHMFDYDNNDYAMKNIERNDIYLENMKFLPYLFYKNIVSKIFLKEHL